MHVCASILYIIWNLGSCTARSCWVLGIVKLTVLLIYSENMGSFSKCSQSLRVSSASPDNSASCSSLGRKPLHLDIRLKRLKGGLGWKAIPDNVLALDKATKVSPALAITDRSGRRRRIPRGLTGHRGGGGENSGDSCTESSGPGDKRSAAPAIGGSVRHAAARSAAALFPVISTAP